MNKPMERIVIVTTDAEGNQTVEVIEAEENK